MRHHNAASQQHPPCSSLPAVYLMATPSFCLLYSLSISPSLHFSVIPSLNHGHTEADGDCKALWCIPASQSVSACCFSNTGEKAEVFPTLHTTYAAFQLVPVLGGEKNLQNGLEWQHVNRDRQREIGDTFGGINHSGMLLPLFPPAWVRATVMEAKWRIKFAPLQTCLSSSLCSVVWGLSL